MILPSTPRSFKWFFPSGFPTKTLYTPLLSPIRATCTAHLILLDFVARKNIGIGVQVKALRAHKLYYRMLYIVLHLAHIRALISLYQINTDDYAYALSKHHFNDTICHFDVLRPVKGLPRGLQLIHSSSKANKMSHQKENFNLLNTVSLLRCSRVTLLHVSAVCIDDQVSRKKHT